jgi:hypothetical protein
VAAAVSPDAGTSLGTRVRALVAHVAFSGGIAAEATPMLTKREGSLLSRSRPSSISTSAAAAALSGESASRFASSSTFAPTASAAP